MSMKKFRALLGIQILSLLVCFLEFYTVKRMLKLRKAWQHTLAIRTELCRWVSWQTNIPPTMVGLTSPSTLSIIYTRTWVEWEGSFLLISTQVKSPSCTYFSLYVITFLLRHSAGMCSPWVAPHRSVGALQAPRHLVCSWSWTHPDTLPKTVHKAPIMHFGGRGIPYTVVQKTIAMFVTFHLLSL